MLYSFKLTMPSNNSWNGRWSGDGKLYVRVHSIPKSKSDLTGYYTYRFSDGWVAAVEVEKIDSNASRKLRKLSKGFCGYDWMISSIIKNGEIITESKSNNNE